jgi:putative ABC transport system permease protein
MKLSLVKAELLGRPARTLMGALSLAIGLALFLMLEAYGAGYREAARAPLTEIGSDIVAQREGVRPESFEGIVFPHSAAPIRAEQVDRITRTPGVEAIGRAMFFWSFQDDDLVVALGIDPGETVGPGRLRAGLREGRFLNLGETGAAVLDSSYAAQRGLAPGSSVDVAGTRFQVVGVVDTSRAGQVANANVYLPLSDAQRMVEAAPGVRAVHQPEAADVNVVFVRAHPALAAEVVKTANGILGQGALITTPQSFDKTLGATFGLIDRFGRLVGFAALLIAAAGLLRTVVGNLGERRRDIAVLRAVGWPRRTIAAQLAAETFGVVALGLVAGITLSYAGAWALSQTQVTIPIPWELSPTPHFLAGGARELSVTVPLAASLNPALILLATALSLVAAVLVAVVLARRVAHIKPSEVWRVD